MTPERRAQFGAALRKVMLDKGVSQSELGREIGTNQAAVYGWISGRHMPMVETAQRIADYLEEPKLLTLCIRLRTLRCEICERPLVRGGKTIKVFCSPQCAAVAEKGAPRKKFKDTDGRQAAIDLMCRTCEPEGACRVADCALRPFSPLPFIPLNRRRD